MNNEVFFSVIVPTKNRRDLLDQAIESILNQSCQNFEIIVVNDHGKEINDIKNDKVIILNNEGQGRSAARNTGIRNAKGRYITFLDDDDLYHKEYLNTFYESILKNGADKIYRQNFQQFPNISKRAVSISYNKEKHKNPFQFVLNNMSSVSIACPKELLLEEKFDERFDLWEDTHLLLRLLTKAEFFQIEQSNYFYRIHPDMGSKKLIEASQSILELCQKNIEPMKDILQNKTVMNFIKDKDIFKIIAQKYLQYGVNSKDKTTFLRSSLKYGFYFSLWKEYLYLFIK